MREWVVAGLIENDCVEVVVARLLTEEVEPGLHQLWMRDHDVALLAFLLDPVETVPGLDRPRPHDRHSEPRFGEDLLEPRLDVPLARHLAVDPDLVAGLNLTAADVEQRLLLGIDESSG